MKIWTARKQLTNCSNVDSVYSVRDVTERCTGATAEVHGAGDVLPTDAEGTAAGGTAGRSC